MMMNVRFFRLILANSKKTATPHRLLLLIIILLDQSAIFGINHDIRAEGFVPKRMPFSQDPLLNEQQTMANEAKRKRLIGAIEGTDEGEPKQIHSVRRTVDAFHHRQLFDKVMARRADRFRTIKRQKRRKADQIYDEEGRSERGGDEPREMERMLLSNEHGLERASVIVVPIDSPKILTAQTFIGTRRIEAELAKPMIVSHRVQGEADSKVPKDMEQSSAGDGPTYTGHVKEMPMPTKQFNKNEAVPSTDVDSPIGRRFRAKHWQLPPALLATRLLNRFNKTEIVKGIQQRNAKRMGKQIERAKLHELMQQIDILQRKPTKPQESPPMSFLIDDAPHHRNIDINGEKPSTLASNSPVMVRPNLRMKYPKNRESTKPILLSKTDESDMDLLRSTDSDLKPHQHISGQLRPPPLLAPSVPRMTLSQPVPIPILPSIGVPSSPTPPIPIHHPPIITQPQPSRPHQNSLLAASVLTTTTPSQLNANAKLELCCRKQNLPSSCQQFCNFDTFTQEKLLIALLGTQCPSAQLTKAFDCATSKVDHSECCRMAGIDQINDGQCMVFCRTHIKTPPNVAGYVSCLSAFGTIKNCYRDHQLRHKNLFGD